MPKFEYKALDTKGRVRMGMLSATNKAEAKVKIKKMKLRFLSLKVTKDPNASDDDGEDTPILGKFLFKDSEGNLQIQIGGEQLPSTKEIIIFSKQLATMLSSGVPLIQAVGVLAKQQKVVSFRRALKKIKAKVENGSTFSAGLAEYPKIFDTLYVAMISAGEASGNLDKILLKLVTYIEKAEKIRSQVKSAMMYPLIVMLVAISVVVGLLVFVIPVFAAQFAESGRELPGLTQAVIDFSEFFQAQWMTMAAAVVAAYTVFTLWKNSPKGQIAFDGLILKSPVIGPLLRKIAVGRFCSTMSSMLSSGVNLLEALDICAASSGNKTIENFVLGVKKGLEKGQKFSEPLAHGGLFPDLVISMVMVGETSGALDDMLNKVSIFYEEEVDMAVKTMLSMIEPIMIVSIGGVIALVVVAMYLPIFDMAGNVTG